MPNTGLTTTHPLQPSSATFPLVVASNLQPLPRCLPSRCALHLARWCSGLPAVERARHQWHHHRRAAQQFRTAWSKSSKCNVESEAGSGVQRPRVALPTSCLPSYLPRSPPHRGLPLSTGDDPWLLQVRAAAPSRQAVVARAATATAKVATKPKVGPASPPSSLPFGPAPAYPKICPCWEGGWPQEVRAGGLECPILTFSVHDAYQHSIGPTLPALGLVVLFLGGEDVKSRVSVRSPPLWGDQRPSSSKWHTHLHMLLPFASSIPACPLQPAAAKAAAPAKAATNNTSLAILNK